MLPSAANSSCRPTGPSTDRDRYKRSKKERQSLEGVIAAVEGLKGESWAAFRDRYGDWGSDLVLYLGRKDCALKLQDLGQAVGGIDYGSVGAAVHRFERRVEKDPSLAERIRQARVRLRNVECKDDPIHHSNTETTMSWTWICQTATHGSSCLCRQLRAKSVNERQSCQCAGLTLLWVKCQVRAAFIPSFLSSY